MQTLKLVVTILHTANCRYVILYTLPFSNVEFYIIARTSTSVLHKNLALHGTVNVKNEPKFNK
jgi:hypothetical protein